MRFLPQWLKKLLKRSKTLVKIRWELHLLKDWWGTRIWKRTTQVVTPLGFKLTSGFHPAYKLMREGKFEPEESQLIVKILARIDVFIDVGANLGYYTCLALANGKYVVAFEPQKQNLECLFRNIQTNGWQEGVEVFPLALSYKPGLLTLYGASGPSASLLKNWAGYSSKYQQVVPVSTLDIALSKRFSGKRLLIKIDVEGAEYQVLKGARDTLCATPKPVWLLEVCLNEFHPDGMNPDFLEIFHLFWNSGYMAYTATNIPRLVTPENVSAWIERMHTDSRTFNYIFIESEVAPCLW